jgi:IS5 family transposase
MERLRQRRSATVRPHDDVQDPAAAALYSLPGASTEFQIKDRLLFQRFLGLGLDSRLPDATTVPLLGYKKHIRIDRAHGLIRTSDASATNAHNGARLPEAIGKQKTGYGAWADTAYQ